MTGIDKKSVCYYVTNFPTLSKATLDVAGRFKSGQRQIESFALEAANLGAVLNQLRRFYDVDDWNSKPTNGDLASRTTWRLGALFSEIERYNRTLYSTPGTFDNQTFRGSNRWIFNVMELQYLRARVDSMRYSLFFMMTVQCVQDFPRKHLNFPTWNDMQQCKLFALESNLCVQRLRSIEDRMISRPPPDGIADTDLVRFDQMTLIDLDASYGARVAMDAIVKTNKLFNPLSEFGQSRDSQQSATPPLSFCYDPNLPTELETELSKISSMIDRYIQHNAVDGSVSQAQAAGTVDSASSASSARQEAIKDGKTFNPTSTADRGIIEIPAVDLLIAYPTNIEDPCFKVLPHALRYRGIKAPWTHYDLYIIHNDGQQCCGLWEKPRRLFKALDKGGKNPFFDVKKRDMPHVWPASGPAFEEKLNSE